MLMDVIKLNGTDKKLYELVGPLTMSQAVLRQNNNYPFKTGLRYVWYVAVDMEQVLGFMPVRRTATDDYIIDNYYAKGDDATVIDRLLTEVFSGRDTEAALWATVHKRHAEQFGRRGFRVHLAWKNYEKMLYCPK